MVLRLGLRVSLHLGSVCAHSQDDGRGRVMKCRWIDDRCQHGYWLDDTEVKHEVVYDDAAQTKGKSKFLCPKGQAA